MIHSMRIQALLLRCGWATTASAQVLTGGAPNASYGPLHAWYDVNQSLEIWEGRTDQYDDEYLVDVRDTATGSGDPRGGSYGTNVETWAQFDESGGDFWPERVGGLTGQLNGMATWEIRNAAGWDDRDSWIDEDSDGTVGIGHDGGYTIMMALNIYETNSYNSVWNGDPIEAKDDTPILNGSTSLFNAGATDGEEPGKGLLWLDTARSGYEGPVWVMDAGVEMVAGNVALDAWQVHTFVYNGSDSKHYIDGVLAASGDAGETAMESLALWSTDGGWHRAGNLDFAEGLFYDTVLSDADRAGLESYLASKWAIGAEPVDIDSLSAAIRAGATETRFDLNGDGAVNNSDRVHWVEETSKTYFGDSNLYGEFNTADFVAVFTFGEYEDAVAGNSLWAEGDWDGNGDFDSGDFVTAFAAGGYEAGPRAAVSAVPEPSSLLLFSLGMCAIRGCRRARRA